MTDSNRSNANKFTYRSPKKGKSPEHRADKPKENAVIKYYLKRFFNSIDITRKKRIIQVHVIMVPTYTLMEKSLLTFQYRIRLQPLRILLLKAARA